jgi:hypothetical protein
LRTDQIDAELKAIYRDLADGRLTDEAAGAAETALQARRAGRDRAGPAEPPRPAPCRPGAATRPGRREKVFGLGRPRALDRNAKVRIMHWARCLSRRTEKGRAYGPITAKAMAVLEALLWGFHNAKSGLCFPGYETIAEAAGCARSTVAEALKALEETGVLTWINRIKRIREPCPDLLGADGWRWRVLRTSNAYSFRDPAPSADRSISSSSEKPTRTLNQDSFSSLRAASGGERTGRSGRKGLFEEGAGAIVRV